MRRRLFSGAERDRRRATRGDGAYEAWRPDVRSLSHPWSTVEAMETNGKERVEKRKRRGPPPSECRLDDEAHAAFVAAHARIAKEVVALVPVVARLEEAGDWRAR